MDIDLGWGTPFNPGSQLVLAFFPSLPYSSFPYYSSWVASQINSLHSIRVAGSATGRKLPKTQAPCCESMGTHLRHAHLHPVSYWQPI